jgi:4-amino-4-deoxy-L-arabinose transferase-like glycosyltransferase
MQVDTYAQVASSDSSEKKGILGSTRSGLIWLAVAIALAALFARIMTYPLQHDEQFYLPAAILFSFDGLYSDLGFSHLPNLPLLLSGVFAVVGGEHYVLVGRLVIFLSWLVTIGALMLIGRRYARSDLVAAVLVALLIANPALLDATGMAVTNNFIATPFALLGLLAFIEAATRPVPSRGLAALAGFLLAVAVGFKANYVVVLPPVAIAAILVPPHLTMRARLAQLTLPLLLGGIIGGAPTLYFLARDPTGFVAHVVSFHRGPQIGYWRANADPLDPKAIGLSAKMLMAQRSWLSGTNLIVLLALAFYATLGLRGAQFRSWSGAAARWPVMLLMCVTALAAIASFLPTPAFPQYFTTALPFALMLIACLHGSLDADGQSLARPFLIAALVMAALIGTPILLSTAPKIVSVARWTGFQVHRDANNIAKLANGGGQRASMATLSPVYALEGKLKVYPALAMGPFVYRASAWIPAGERVHYTHLTSPATVDAMLESAPPAAILTGEEGELDAPLSAFAVAHGYIAHPIRMGRGSAARDMVLFTRSPILRGPVAFDYAAPPGVSGSALTSAPARH